MKKLNIILALITLVAVITSLALPIDIGLPNLSLRSALADTSITFYPDAHTETTSVDGLVQGVGGSTTTWANIWNGNVTAYRQVYDDVSAGYAANIKSNSNADRWDYLTRSAYLFDTSSIPEGSTITSATFSLYCVDKGDPAGWAPSINIYSTSPVSNTALAANDYITLGTTAYSDPKGYSGITLASYNDFALNATGLSAISTTGITKIGLRANYDATNVAPTWSASKEFYIWAYFAEQGGSYRPKLTVTYTTEDCSGTTNFGNQTSQNDYNILHSGGYFRTGQYFTNFPASTISAISIMLYKTGSPTGTGNLTIRKASDDSVLGILGTIDVSTLTGNATWKTFNSTPVVNSAQQDIRIGLEYNGGNVSNCPAVRKYTLNTIGCSYMYVYVGATSSYASDSTQDLTWGNLTYTTGAIGVSSVSPHYGFRGQTLTSIVITGWGLTGATSVSLGTAVTTNSFIVNNDTQITVNVTIAASTEARLGNVVVIAPAGTGTLANAFSIDWTYFASDAWGYNWNTLSNPPAYHYAGAHDRTYIAYQGPPSFGQNVGDIYVTYFDNDTKTWATAVDVATCNGPGGSGYYDTDPTITVTSDGHIVIAYNSQGGGAYIKTKRSTNAEDISSWGSAVNTVYGWYPSLVRVANGDLYMLCQPSYDCRVYSYIKSTNGGQSWSGLTSFMSFTDSGTSTDQLCGFWTYDAPNDLIVGAVTQFMTTGIGAWQEQWYIKYNPTTGVITDQAGGYNSSAPLSKTNANSASYKFVAWNNPSECTYNGAVALDYNGTPYMMFVISAGGRYGTYSVNFTRWNGSSWTSPTIVATSWWGSAIAIDPIGPTLVNAYFPTGDGLYNCTSMSHYQWNGSSWSLVRIMVDASTQPKSTFEASFIGTSGSGSSSAYTMVIFTAVDYATYNGLRAYAYFMPKPIATTQATTSIGTTTATFNGTITDTSGDTVITYGWQWGLTQVPTWAWQQGNGDYTGAQSHAISTLSAGTTYWVRFYDANSQGTAYGSWMSFTTSTGPTPTLTPTPTPTPTPSPTPTATPTPTPSPTPSPTPTPTSVPGLPTITTMAATYISTTSAQLNGYVNNSGGIGITCTVRFSWGEGTCTPASVSYTSWQYGKTTGNYFNATISGLSTSTTYSFYVEAYNTYGTAYGVCLEFTTQGGVLDISSFTAIPAPDSPSIILRWAWPASAASTTIRYKPGGYPSSTSDGTLVTSMTRSEGSSYEQTGLVAGQTLYYSAWGISGGNTSGSTAHAMATVSLANTASNPSAPSQPTNWFRDVAYTNMSTLPGYGIVNWTADSFGFSREYFWLSLGLMVAILGFIGAYIISKGNPMTASLFTLVILSVEVPMGLTAGFMAFLWAFIAVIIIVMKVRT